MHLISVFPAHQFIAVQGANIGDALSFADDLLLDDVYCCKTELHQIELGLIWMENGFFIAHDSACGTPSNAIHMDSSITFMADDGETVQALVLVETSPDYKCEQIYLLAQSPFVCGKNYALIQIERAELMQKFAKMGCTSFCAGTRITTANGQMMPVETLTVGQMVLTRDNGPQPIQWIGRNSERAVGDFAPIVITAGTLQNQSDLMVTSDHRFFIYDRGAAHHTARMVEAKDLVNGTTIYPAHLGHMDYVQILFEDHQIIFAEGIGLENTRITPQNRYLIADDENGIIAFHAHPHKK